MRIRSLLTALSLLLVAAAARAEGPGIAPAPIAPVITRVPEPAPEPAPEVLVLAPTPTATAPAVAVPATPAPAPAVFDPQHFTLRIHLLDAPKAVLRGTASGEPVVCPAPCDRVLHLRPTDQFTIAGEGIDESESFPFIPRDGEVKLHVKPGSTARTAGAWVLLGGTAAAALGGWVGLYGTTARDPFFCSNACGRYDSTITAANGLGVAGLAAMAVGALLLVANPATTHWSE